LISRFIDPDTQLRNALWTHGLAQILDGLDPKEFRRCAERHPMARETPALSAYDHFAVMVFAQLTYRESLRDIEACLSSRPRLLYHSGIRGTLKRCNLAYANEHRSATLFAEIAMVLMRRARRLYADTPTELHLDGDLFAIDATLIELSLAIFPWARWQGTQAAVKECFSPASFCPPIFLSNPVLELGPSTHVHIYSTHRIGILTEK
jgi:Domain of unknown function (DUF4372)